MISHRHRCIFIEIPKTGSGSIRDIVGHPPHPHMNVCQVRQEMGRNWTRYGGIHNRIIAILYPLLPQRTRESIGGRQFESYFKFAFVRNPWDRVVSLYFRREGLQLRDTMTFTEFVDWIKYSSSTCTRCLPHTNQLDWIVDPHGNVLVDFVGRFENLQADWEQIADRLGYPPTLTHRNRNMEGRKPYSEYYTPETRDIIANKFRVDIEHFGYSF